MQRIWKYIYLCWVVVCLASGYGMLAPEHTAPFKGMPWSDIVMFFLFWCIAPMAVMALNFHGLDVIFRRPSLERPPWGGRNDPLQFFRLGLVTVVSVSVGACFALPKANQGGAMWFWAMITGTVGFFIGERLVYWVYAKRIAKSTEQHTVK